MIPLRDAQERAWSRAALRPASAKQALEALQESVSVCLKAFEAQQDVAAQVALEDALLAVLLALETFDLDADRGLTRALERAEATDRIVHLYPDRAEVWVGQECRGAWPLYTPEDTEMAWRLALELQCKVFRHGERQLTLFEAGEETLAPAPNTLPQDESPPMRFEHATQ